jgi:tRNA-modifying protein YgfZ
VTDIRPQYRIIATGAGRAARRDRGRIRFAGADAPSFLQALVSNDVESLVAGRGVYATYLTPQGRMISDLRIHHRRTHLLAEVPAAIAARLVGTFDGVIFSEDVSVTDVSAAIGQILVAGERAAEVTALSLGIEVGQLDALAPLAHVEVGERFVARSDDVGVPAFDVFVPAQLLDETTARLDEAGAIAMSPELVEALRIEAGRPAYGVDMTDETIPLEAGLLERAISTTKGCYVGQEIIIRVLHRGAGRVARRLARLEIDSPSAEPPAPGAIVSVGGRDVGRVTSSAPSPSRDRVIALGYVHRDAAEAGQHVVITTPAASVEAVIVGFAG